MYIRAINFQISSQFTDIFPQRQKFILKSLKSHILPLGATYGSWWGFILATFALTVTLTFITGQHKNIAVKDVYGEKKLFCS